MRGIKSIACVNIDPLTPALSRREREKRRGLSRREEGKRWHLCRREEGYR
jgi:hypothetical protein